MEYSGWQDFDTQSGEGQSQPGRQGPERQAMGEERETGAVPPGKGVLWEHAPEGILRSGGPGSPLLQLSRKLLVALELGCI